MPAPLVIAVKKPLAKAMHWLGTRLVPGIAAVQVVETVGQVGRIGQVDRPPAQRPAVEYRRPAPPAPPTPGLAVPDHLQAPAEDLTGMLVIGGIVLLFISVFRGAGRRRKR